MRSRKCRYELAITLAFYMCVCYMCRVDINVTILSMVNGTAHDHEKVNSHPAPKPNSSGSISQEILVTKNPLGEIYWDRPTRGLILGAFFWGYLMTQVLGLLLADQFGPKIIGILTIVGFSFAEMLIPTAASVGHKMLMAMRIIQGALQGVGLPLRYCLIGRWIPSNERSRVSAFVHSGCHIGVILGQSIAGMLSKAQSCQYSETHHSHCSSLWPYVHYLFGSLGFLLSVVWLFTVFNTPAEHPRISPDELEYIHSNNPFGSLGPWRLNNAEMNGQKQNRLASSVVTNSISVVRFDSDIRPERFRDATPKLNLLLWRQILSSPPFWSILICHVTSNWVLYSVITCMPDYMLRVQGFDLSSNGLLLSVPYLVEIFVAQLAGYVSDVLVVRNLVSLTWVRRWNNFIALSGAGLFLLLVGLVGSNRIAAVLLLTIAIGLMGFDAAGYFANMVDLAPNYAGNIVSLTNTLATLPGILGPLLVGYVTKDKFEPSRWMIVFGASAAVSWTGAITNMFLTSGITQPWGEYQRTPSTSSAHRAGTNEVPAGTTG